MHPAAATLLDAVTAALPEFVTECGGDAAAIGEVGALRALLATPFVRQEETPLEVIRELVAAAGCNPAALASPLDLGEAVWQAHLAWGAAKARAVAQPARIRWEGSDLMDRSRLEVAVAALGAQLVSDDPDVAVVDLARPDGVATVAELVAAGVRVVAYGPHVDAEVMAAAAGAGAETYPRSVFFRDPASLLAPRRG